MATLAFDEVFLTEYPKLVALGAAMAGDREVARELAQETMLRAHRRWAEIERYDEPGAWMRRVMTNLLIDHHRSRTAERNAVDRLRTSAAHGADGIPTGATPWAELIAPLTPTQRIVATLFYADDLAVADIAHALGVSDGSVKSTLAKVRRRLRRALTEAEES